MTVIAGWMIRRFLRLELWTVAFALPLALFLWAFFLTDQSPEYAYSVLLVLLTYLIPVLSSVHVLTSVDRSRWDLILTRRIGFPGLLLGTWLGGVTPFLVCSLALITVGVALGIGTSFPPESGGVEYFTDVRVERNPPDGLRGRARLEHTAPWRFEVRRVRPTGAPQPEAYQATLRALVGRYGGSTDDAPLVQVNRVQARVTLPALEDADPERSRLIELRDNTPIPLSIPGRAVGEDGHLVVLVAPDRPEPEAEHDGDQHDQHDQHGGGQPGGDGKQSAIVQAHSHDGARVDDPPGPIIFWFRRGVDSNDNPATGLLVIERRISFLANFVRAGLQATGLILLLAGVTTFAAALFSWAVAFVFSVTLFICGSGMSLLRELAESLSYRESAVFRWVQGLLDFWIAVLPDFGALKGAEYLFAGEAIRWSTVLDAHGIALGYSAAFLTLAVVCLWRWEVGR